MLHIAVTIAVAFPSSVWKKSHRRGTLVNGATLSYCEISNKKKKHYYITFAVLKPYRSGERIPAKGGALLDLCQAGLFLLRTWYQVDPAAFAWPVVNRNRCVWAIRASGSSPSKMDISGLLGGFPKQSLQGCGHGEAPGCSLTVKSSAQENQTSLHVCLTVVFWPSFTAGELLWSSQL